MLFLKRYIYLILSIFTIISSGANAADRLIIHFDINNTLIASDRIENKSSENAICFLLAKKHVDYWDKTLSEPISYYDYVYNVVVPGDSKDKDLKKIRKQYLDRFIDDLREQQHPLYAKINEEFNTMNTKLSSLKGTVFASFYKLLKFLDAEQIQYSIILRTFGGDLDFIAAEINETLGTEFFAAKANFKNGALVTEFGTLTDAESIYGFMTTSGNLMIQDDWNPWNLHHESSEYGKPFYLKPDDTSVFQIFFDDNIEIDDDVENIIGPKDVKTNLPIKVSEIIKTKNAVRVNTIDAILNDDYFTKHVMDTALNASTSTQ